MIWTSQSIQSFLKVSTSLRLLSDPCSFVTVNRVMYD